MTYYRTRYAARKDARNNEVVVKVTGPDGEPAYILMSGIDYKIWRRQR